MYKTAFSIATFHLSFRPLSARLKGSTMMSSSSCDLHLPAEDDAKTEPARQRHTTKRDIDETSYEKTSPVETSVFRT